MNKIQIFFNKMNLKRTFLSFSFPVPKAFPKRFTFDFFCEMLRYNLLSTSQVEIIQYICYSNDFPYNIHRPKVAQSLLIFVDQKTLKTCQFCWMFSSVSVSGNLCRSLMNRLKETSKHVQQSLDTAEWLKILEGEQILVKKSKSSEEELVMKDVMASGGERGYQDTEIVCKCLFYCEKQFELFKCRKKCFTQARLSRTQLASLFSLNVKNFLK